MATRILPYLIAISLLVPLVNLSAQTQPHNDPLEIISNRPRPNVLMLFDTSGSMLWDVNRYYSSDMSVRRENNNGQSSELRSTGYSDTSNGMNSFLLDSDNSRSRMGQAKEATREILSQIQDVNIGMGRFKRKMWQHRFRAEVPSDLNQLANMEAGYNYYWWDDQQPVTGQINIPYRRQPISGGDYEYPRCRLVRRDGGVYYSWDATDMEWTTSYDNEVNLTGGRYIRMNWSYSKVENARRQMFKGLTDDGWFIYRGNYSSPDERHPNKLNQVVNIDIFISDSEMMQLKSNFELEETLTMEHYIDTAYGVTINRTLDFTYWPQIADWDEDYSCSGGEIVVGIQNRFEDDFDTEEDESDNREELMALTAPINTNANIYDFTTDTPTLTENNAFWGFGSTPLATTLQTAKGYFNDVITPRDVTEDIDHCRDNFVILLTDGLETCGGNPESVAQDLYQNYGIKVYVIAFISQTSQADAIAEAGGTGEAFNADNKDELVEALQAIFAEIKTSVELAAPVTASSSETAGDYVEGDTALFPFFDFPGFKGRLQARKIFKKSVVEVDPKTGSIVTDVDGNPVVIEDDITDERVLELVNDPSDPIEQDPAREIVGLQNDPPTFLWDAGSLLSQPFIEEEDSALDYPYLQEDVDDLDDDNNTSEEIVNPAYKTADERNILTTLSTSGSMAVVNFDTATLMASSQEIAATKTLLDVESWSDDELEFLINYIRGKKIVRFTQTTELYGHTFQPGDPKPDPDSADGDDDDLIPDEYLYTERSWKLGDIISSTPVVIRSPSGTYPININDNDNSLHDFDEYAAAHDDINPLVIIGANDGMVHAFTLNGIDANDDGDFSDSGDYYPGEEVWAFILPDLMPKLKNLYYDSPDDDDFEPDGQKLEPHQYFVDGQFTLSISRLRIHTGDTDGDGKSDDPEFRTVLLFGEGRGGNYYWMFDLTDPMNPQPVWALTDSSMGMTISRPAVGPIEVGTQTGLDKDTFRYYVFMGSGYDFTQTDGNATVGNSFYKVDMATGTIVESVNVGDEPGGAAIPNAIVSRGIVVDDDDDFFVERAYFADLDGALWRWDLETGGVENLFEANATAIVSEQDQLDRPIADSYTYGNIFGFHVITAATGGDTRLYLESDDSRATYPDQRIYLLVDTDKQGDVVSYLNGDFSEEGEFVSDSGVVGATLPSYMISENQPVIATFTEYDDQGQIYRGFQTFYPLYTPDPAGLKSIRCTFGESDLLILDSIFSESNIVESTTGALISMGEGKATGISYSGGNILFSLGDQFKVYGSGVYRFESNQRVKARLKVLSWKEIF